MPYDEFLAERVRQLSSKKDRFTEKKMFGGLAFLLHGNMACGIVGERLMLRLGEEGAALALGEPNVVPMDFTGKPIKTMVFVEPPGIERDEDLEGWVEASIAFARTLPKK